MKWFSHETNAHTNLKLHQLIQETGMKGYGYYWFLVELVGSQGENFRVIAGKSWKKFAEFWTQVGAEEQEVLLEKLAELNLIDKKALKSGTLYIPKLKERADDYTKRVRRVSEQASDNVPLQYNTEQDKTIPFSSKAYIQKFKESPQRHIQVIGLYLEHKGFELPSAEAFKPEIGQSFKYAKGLSAFTDEQIIQTMAYLDGQKLDYIWKLSTVSKQITSVINNRR